MSASAPKVFISYSRDSEPHKDWVRELATDLKAQGISVSLDQWHLLEGQDVGLFMEESFQEADYVVVVCTAQYGHKANGRTGGVGYEHAIFTGFALTQGQQDTRLLPILRAGDSSSALPVILRNRLFIDFRDDAIYEQAFNQLVRRIYGVREHPEPVLGARPAFANPQTTKKTWVLVAGIGGWNLAQKIQDTSKAVGSALAQAGFGLVTGGWDGVDYMTTHSFAQELARLGLPLEDWLTQVVVAGTEPSFQRGSLVLGRDHDEQWTESIKRADAVVLIGGVEGTKETAEYGLMLGRPVLPLRETGGAAEKFYDWMYRNWQPGWLGGFDRSRFAVLARETATVIPALVRLLTEVAVK